ncbi:MAG: hypothetical protein RL536_425 [Candidatus Parcubacteria bacterium]|jgi:hypothetical protein
MKYRFLLFFVGSFILLSLSVSAQVPVSTGGLELTASAENPSPGQTVTITAKSYTIDINGAKVSWTVNGVVKKSATGATSLDVVAPELGKTLSIRVTATTQEGKLVLSSITVGSGSVDLILETDGYVPPMFKGKVAPVYQNTVKIIAMPHIANAGGVEYDPKTLVYQWKKNDRVLEDQSGYGKQSISLVGDIVPRPYDITVDVWSKDNVAHSQGRMGVVVGEPTINFYVNDPLYGTLLNQAIKSVIGIGSQKETSVIAVPFGFNKTSSGVGGLSWSWSVNNSGHEELSSSQSVVLRAPDDTDGSSNIQLDIKNTDKILQGASSGFTATFATPKDKTTESSTL